MLLRVFRDWSPLPDLNEWRLEMACGEADYQGKTYWIAAGGGTSYSNRILTIEASELLVAL